MNSPLFFKFGAQCGVRARLHSSVLFKESPNVEACTSNYDNRLCSSPGIFQFLLGVVGPFAESESLVGILNIQQPVPTAVLGLRCAHVESAIDLECVGIDQ